MPALKLSNSWSAVAGSMAVVVGLLATAGCGSDDTVDASKAEQGIESSSLSTSTTQITSASCPDDVKKEKDKTFTCDVKLSGGGKAQVTVTQTTNHDTFSYAFRSGTVELPGSTVDKEIEQELADAGIKGATVNCPATIPVKPGTTVTCPVTSSSGRNATVSFEFTDSSGTVDSSSVTES
jgi:plastocyanin